jgi:hypothetical protein
MINRLCYKSGRPFFLLARYSLTMPSSEEKVNALKKSFRHSIAAIIGSAIVAGFSAKVIAAPVTVEDTTDWQTTPEEVVSLDLPDVPYNGGVYAGINTVSVNGTTYSAFCIDPFHYSLSGSQAYNTVALADAPKAPGPMGATAAYEIEELWGEYFPTAEHSPTVAAGLQLAIWELVVDSVAANNGKPATFYFSINGANDYGAAADIASLATYNGPVADLIGLTGPGQDYVIDAPGTPNTGPLIPDGGATAALLGVALAGLGGFGRKLGRLGAIRPRTFARLRA